MNKGTIIYIGGFELPDKNAAAHRVLSNAKILRELGYNVVFIGVNKALKKTDLNKYIVQGFDAYDIKYPTTIREWFFFSTSIKHFKKIIKIYNSNTVIAYNLPAVQLHKFFKFKNFKVVADITEWYTPSGNLFFRLAKSFDINLRMKYLHKKLDGLIVISDYLEAYYKSKSVKNIINIPPLVDLKEGKWRFQSSKTDTDSLKFVYSGSPGTGNKDNLDLVVDSLKFFNKSTRKISLKVVGVTQKFYEQHFNNGELLTEDYAFAEFLGKITHEESIKVIQQADFFIFFRELNLTNSAGFPTKFTESISAGTPVITNTSTSLKQYFDQKKIGFIIDYLSKESIAEVYAEIEKLDRATIDSYKKYCYDLKLFDYRNYVGAFSLLTEFNK